MSKASSFIFYLDGERACINLAPPERKALADVAGQLGFTISEYFQRSIENSPKLSNQRKHKIDLAVVSTLMINARFFGTQDPSQRT